MTMLEKTCLRVSPLTQKIQMVRFGKDPRVALEKKDATGEFWQALIAFAFDGKLPEKGAACAIEFGSGDEQYSLRLERKL